MGNFWPWRWGRSPPRCWRWRRSPLDSKVGTGSSYKLWRDMGPENKWPKINGFAMRLFHPYKCSYNYGPLLITGIRGSSFVWSEPKSHCTVYSLMQVQLDIHGHGQVIIPPGKRHMTKNGGDFRIRESPSPKRPEHFRFWKLIWCKFAQMISWVSVFVGRCDVDWLQMDTKKNDNKKQQKSAAWRSNSTIFGSNCWRVREFVVLPRGSGYLESG